MSFYFPSSLKLSLQVSFVNTEDYAVMLQLAIDLEGANLVDLDRQLDRQLGHLGAIIDNQTESRRLSGCQVI